MWVVGKGQAGWWEDGKKLAAHDNFENQVKPLNASKQVLGLEGPQGVCLAS